MAQLQMPAASSTSQSPFFRIPPELRRRIYGYALRDRVPISMGADGSVCGRLMRSMSDCSEEDFNRRSILRTCKIIYAEALPILYQTNTFTTERAMDLRSFRRKTSLARLKLNNVHYFFFYRSPMLNRTRIIELKRMSNLKKVIIGQNWFSDTFGHNIRFPAPSVTIYGSAPGVIVDNWMMTWATNSVWSHELRELLTARPNLNCDVVMEGDTVYRGPIAPPDVSYIHHLFVPSLPLASLSPHCWRIWLIWKLFSRTLAPNEILWRILR